MTRFVPSILAALALAAAGSAFAQETIQNAAPSPARGSIVEDRAARKLMEAGDARIDADETEKALEIWRSVIERYPRSKVRYEAHLRLGDYLLDKKRAFDEARGHFEIVSQEANTETEQRSEAMLKAGICFYEGRHYGQCFKTLRVVIEDFPESGNVNQAYYYIGLGHFKLGHYSRAIEALEKVGTALTEEDSQIEKVEAGKRLFLKIDDNDLAILEPGDSITVECRAESGDVEKVSCNPIGRQVRVVLGSIPTSLGRAIPNNGRLEVKGGDKIEVTYVDSHTADKQFDQPRLFSVSVVGTAVAQITDGSFADTLNGVVIGKQANVQIFDADMDRTDNADSLGAVAEIWTAKSDEELDAELAALAASGDLPDPNDPEADQPKIEKFKKVNEVAIQLTEIKHQPPPVEDESPNDDVEPDPAEPAAAEVADGAEAAAAPPTGGETAAVAETAVPAETPAAEVPATENPDGVPEVTEVIEVIEDPTFHSGIFRGQVAIVGADGDTDGGRMLQAKPGDLLKIRYNDSVNLSRTARELVTVARCIEGNLGNVRVTKTDIADSELRIKTQLRTAEALTHIGNHYKEFGLQTKAQAKYGEALDVSESVLSDAQKLGGSILEQAYVQLWRTYFAMDNFNLAVAMSGRLMREFPESTFVDEAMLQQASAFAEQGKLPDAIRLFSSILRLNASPLKGEAQFGIAETYERMAQDASAQQSEPLFERAFTEYQKVYEQFPESGRVGDAVAKMANFYYQKKDYARAIDVFENVLSDYPDANFLDVILFNYGRCLYRLERRGEARSMFDQLINEFPESDVAPEAKRISDALVKAGF
ncbi:MAG: tetratricopeptide (TPR) repeat protein [Verrucomicrobiales bacterium]|jgi:tetratricopeptide (TPR) repeat protein